MFISLFVFVIVCGILGKTRICAVYILFVYICIAVRVVLIAVLSFLTETDTLNEKDVTKTVDNDSCLST